MITKKKGLHTRRGLSPRRLPFVQWSVLLAGLTATGCGGEEKISIDDNDGLTVDPTAARAYRSLLDSPST